MKRRALTGAILVGAILAAFWAGPWTTLTLFGALAAVGVFELANMLARRPRLGRSRSFSVPTFAAGVLWIAAPMLGVAALVACFGPALATAWFLLIWTQDTGAYLSGKTLGLGRRKMWPRYSPGKTWEGWAGGTVLTVIIALQLPGWFPSAGLGTSDWLCLAAIIAVFGTLGDLLESVVKRRCKVSDSGNILPGHGGVLDRFDAVFLALPLSLVYLFSCPTLTP